MTDVTVIGCGFMGKNHAHAIADNPTLTLASVVDVDEERVADVADTYDAVRALTDYETALDDAEAAVVATPEFVHARQAHAALDRDVHLLLEKPITEDLEEARTLAKRAESASVATGVSFVLRYDPGYSGARNAIADGEIGEPVAARAMRAITIEESRRIGGRGHPLFYMNVHDIDAMRWCLDAEVKRVTAVERRGELEDVDVPDAQQATLEFDSGAIGVLEGYGVLPDDTPGGIVANLDVMGADGRVSVDTPGTMLTVHGESFDRPDTRHWPIVNGRMDGCVRRQIDWFAEAVRGENHLLASMEDGYRAQAVADATLEATRTGESQTVEY